MQHPLRIHIEKIVPLTDEEFAFIFSHFSYGKFKKHEFIIQEGNRVKHHYFILSGLTKLVFTDENAKDHIVSFAMEDWWESDFQAFYMGTPASLSLQCLEDTEVLSITIENYIKLCNELQKIERFLLQKTTSGFIAAQKRIISSLTSNTGQRYDQFLKQYPNLTQRIPKSLIAAYLGVSRETLSRLSPK